MAVAEEWSRWVVFFGLGGFVGNFALSLCDHDLYLRVDLAGHAARPMNNFIRGAPIFAPLLFADLAVLAGFGLWSLQQALLTGSTDRRA